MLESLDRIFGGVARQALSDPETVEIMLNPNGLLFVERLGCPIEEIGVMDASYAETVCRYVAAWHGKEITPDTPLIEGRFPLDGSRFAGQIPPVVAGPTFTIRKRAVRVFKLAEYVESGVMTETQRAILCTAVENHRNILVIGGTGSGKTTLLNAIIGQMVTNNPTERLIIIEDTPEIQCTARNVVPYEATDTVTMTQLVKTALRVRPDRILVGEVRGAEAFDLLMGWNTGHEGGLATVHANNVTAALKRVEMLVSMHSNPPPPLLVQQLIGEVVQVIVHIGRHGHGRRVHSILEVHGFENGQYVTQKMEG